MLIQFAPKKNTSPVFQGPRIPKQKSLPIGWLESHHDIDIYDSKVELLIGFGWQCGHVWQLGFLILTVTVTEMSLVSDPLVPSWIEDSDETSSGGEPGVVTYQPIWEYEYLYT